MTQHTAVFILGFTPEALSSNQLVQMIRAADTGLKVKYPAFRQIMRQADVSQAEINIANQLLAPPMDTLQNMQAALGDWLQIEELPFQPVLGENFFISDSRNEQGQGNCMLFYIHRTA
jgi:hypothetical protein